MNRNAIGGLASIIIPCWNQLEFTRQCITALVRRTRRTWELIVIDNGSTDGTGTYLSGVQDAAAVPVTVIANTANRGFPAAINQGLQQARGEYLVLLNNDVVVTDAWLDQLTALATAKMGAKNGLTAKDAKSAKKVRQANGTGNFAAETLIGLSERPNVTIVDFEEERSASEAQPPNLKISSAVVLGEPRTKDRGPRTNNPFDITVADRSLTTPPGPPFTQRFFRGGLFDIIGSENRARSRRAKGLADRSFPPSTWQAGSRSALASLRHPARYSRLL
jgi:glycosyltransferase involved in cell wall biosynthesis